MAAPFPTAACYGVFLAGATRGARVGELDEEMVFESRTGDTIILGATTWRIEEISHDRVMVSPAPGEPGKMPFWHGDAAGRPAEFGRKIGEMTRELLRLPRPVAFTKLVEEHSLDANAGGKSAALSGRSGRRHRHAFPATEDILIERLPRRTGRLARLRAHPVWQPRPCAVVHGRHGETARRARH